MQATHEIQIDGTWHEAKNYQLRRASKGLPHWALFVFDLNETIQGKELAKAKREGRVREIPYVPQAA